MYNVKEINVPKTPDRALYFFPKAKGLLTGSYKETLAVTVHPPLISVINSLLIQETAAISGRIKSEKLETN